MRVEIPQRGVRSMIINNLDRGTSYKELTGLSTDTKPTKDVGVNSLFLELDTGDFYFFDGEQWQKVGE